MTLPHKEACADCLRAGHVCRAMVYVDQVPLCFACADGDGCPHTATWPQLQTYRIRGEVVRASTGAVMGTELIDPWECRPADRPSAPGGGRRTIAPEVRRAIVAADPRQPAIELARQYGISDVSVMNIRKAAGVYVPMRPRKGRSK